MKLVLILLLVFLLFGCIQEPVQKETATGTIAEERPDYIWTSAPFTIYTSKDKCGEMYPVLKEKYAGVESLSIVCNCQGISGTCFVGYFNTINYDGNIFVEYGQRGSN